MLLGEHEHTIDDKNRLTLPAKFRAAFATGVAFISRDSSDAEKMRVRSPTSLATRK